MASIRQGILDFIRKIPLLGGLPNCSVSDHFDAIQEYFSTMVFSFLPVIIACIVNYLQKDTANTLPFITSNLINNGELLLYVTSILAPVFFVIMRRRQDQSVFPSRYSHILVYFSIILLAGIVFALKRTQFVFDTDALTFLQHILFISSLVLFYLVLVYNNSLIPNPADAIREETDDFYESVRNHRRTS